MKSIKLPDATDTGPEAQTSEEINACWQNQGENSGPLSSGPVSVASGSLMLSVS